MKLETEEFLLIMLAAIVFIAILIVINPTITGFSIYEPSDFTHNEDITLDPIQLTQHSYTTNWTTQETSYYSLTFAEEEGNDKLNKLIALDANRVELEAGHLLKIRFNSNLENNDILNLNLKRDREITLNFCDFNATNSCDNETIYASLVYPGVEGTYQTTLSLLESTNELTIDPVDYMIKIDYINASHTEITEHSNTTYYYNSAEVETETIEPENLSKWDLFEADYTLNNQTITFYYKTDQDYIEFTPPYNFSEINSSLQFKLALSSDNITTPIIYNLSISYIESIPIEEPPEEPASSPSSPSNTGSSVTRFKSSAPAPATETTSVETQTVTQQVELPRISGEVVKREIKKQLPMKLYGNMFLFSLLTFLSYAYYHRRIKNKPKIEIVNSRLG